MNDTAVLEVSALHVEYPGEPVKISGVSFSIARGKIFGIAGESGSGKSTICKAVLGLLSSRARKWGGRILLNAKNISSMDADERRAVNGKEIGYVAQNPAAAFDPCMRIQGHFTETICTHLKCTKKDARMYGEELLLKVGLADTRRILKSYPYQRSGGMLQRIMIAIAISMNPLLIVADEPTTALDAQNRDVISELLLQVSHEFKPAMLLVSHDLFLMRELADCLAVMKDGQIVECGNTEDVLSAPQNEYTKELIDTSVFY